MSEEEKKQRARENAKRYYQKNKEKVLKRQKEYVKKRYREDEEFRNKIKEKNRNYVINNPEKAREIKRKSQHKYINKKRLSGELPLTQKMLIDKLQKENQELKEENTKLNIKLEDRAYEELKVVYEEAKEEIGTLEYTTKELLEANKKVSEERQQLKEQLSKILTEVSTIEHNLEKYEEIGLESHFDYALHKTWELKEYLIDLLDKAKESE